MPSHPDRVRRNNTPTPVDDPPRHRVPFFRAQRADTLTRDELLIAYTHACDELERLRQQQRQDMDMEKVLSEMERFLSRV